MIINKVWAMPNKQTFEIKPIKELIERYHHSNSIDPFANKNRIASITNDLDNQYDCDYNLDAKDFLSKFSDGSTNLTLFDPPYSPRQISECYKKLGRSVNMQTTQASFWGDLKKDIARLTMINGIVITFGWNSGGVGKKLGFEQIEILLVAHGGWHNDTICTVERKIK